MKVLVCNKNAVLFEETSKLIPTDALVVEIAPHGLLQAILKRSLSECLHVPLTRRRASDPVTFLLEAVGKLYQAGLNPKVDILYPKIEYPVSTGTPFLSQYVRWEHSEDWAQAKYYNKDRRTTKIRDFVMSIHDDDYSYLKGHVRNGNCVFPEAAFLQLIWENLAMYQGVNYRDMSVVFRDVHFHREVIIKSDVPLRLKIIINKGSNRFEVIHENSAIVSGNVEETIESSLASREIGGLFDTDIVTLTAQDVYTIMCLRGYSYKDDFQSIHSTNSNRTNATIKWTGNWVHFLDSIFQFNAFTRDFDGVSTPFIIRKLTINVGKHKEALKIISYGLAYANAELHSIYEYTKCGGVQVEGLVFRDVPVLEQKQDVIFNQEFVPHFLTGTLGLKTALQVNLQLVSENVINNHVKVTNLLANKSGNITKLIKDTTADIPLNDFLVESLGDQIDISTNDDIRKSDLIVMDNMLGNEEMMKKIHKAIPSNTFILTLELNTPIIHLNDQLFDIITAIPVQEQKLILLRKVDNEMDTNISYLPIIHDLKFSWISKLQAELTKSRKIVLVSERQPYCGLLGMVKKLRKEYGNKIGLIILDDEHVPTFNPEENIFRHQLRKKMAFNVLHKGKWGGFYCCEKTGNSFIGAQNMQLLSTGPSDIENLSWVEQPVTSSSNLQVQVCYAGPSFKDVQSAASKISCQNKVFGMDFSGINNRGDKVMGLIPGGAIASTVEADPDLFWPVPEHWTLEEAATVPLPYIHAFYCLMKCNYIKDKSVFVHGGAGALGQAVIAVFLSLDYTVYTTVGDVKKKEFLLRLFPDLDEKNIAHSSDDLYLSMIRSNKKEDGCSIVINCMSGAKRKAAIKVCNISAIFLDLSDHDMLKDEKFEMGFLGKFTRYKAIKLNSIFRPELVMEKKQLQLVLSEGIAKGIVRPLSRVVYSPVNVSRAFRLLASSKHRGKVLIGMKNPDSLNYEIKVASRVMYSSNGTYIVVCDDVVLGMELADQLVKQGARNLVICMKLNDFAGYCYTKFMSWYKLNVTVKISTDYLKTEEGCIILLKEAAKLGPILGIFMVQNYSGRVNLESEDVAVKFTNTASIVANLDLTSRNVCNELDYFVVLNYSSQNVTDEYMASAVDKICYARKDMGVPALSFHIGLLEELDEDNPEWSKSLLTPVFNALERSLNMKYNNVIYLNLKKNVHVEFIQKASKILGVQDINTLDENINLKSLLINDVVTEEMNSLIKEAYKISYSTEKVQEITIANLKNLERMITQESKGLDGLGAFFTYIDKDEWMAAEPTVTMATTYSSVKEEEELDPKATYLMLVPGFEGHHEVFTTLCERLKVQAVAFQYGPELINANVSEMAANIKKFMKKRIQLKSKFYLLGYSFGVNVALELAALFEKEGHIGVVYCLDSSPDALRAQLDAYVGHISNAQLQNNLVEHMYKLMNGQDSAGLMQKLEQTNSWEEKIELCVNKLKRIVNFSHQYKRCILQGAYTRIMLAKEYQPNFKLQSDLVLIRCIPHPKIKKLADDYGLSKYTTKPVQVFNIEADHASAPYDCRVTSIVNRLLDPKLLEAFKYKNLCWSYLANPTKSW